jgi:hypothetical protein
MLDHSRFATAADLPPNHATKPNGNAHNGHALPMDEISAADLQAMEFPPIAWVVPRYLAEGATILAGKPKLGKSWLALDMAIAVARGGYLLGDIKCSEGDVLYAALEDNRRRLQGRMRKVVGDIPWPPRLFFRTKLQRLTDGGIVEIRKWIVSVPRPRLVIIDVLASVRSAKRNQDSPYESDFAALSELKALADEFSIAILIIHHVRKMEADSDPFDAISGTTGLTGACDTALVLKGGPQGVTLYGRGRDVTEVEDAVTFDRDSCRWRLLGDASEVRRSGERSQILEALREDGGEMSPQEIARVTGSSSTAIRQMLGRMAKDGEVVKIKRGRYALPQDPCHNGHNVTTEESDDG